VPIPVSDGLGSTKDSSIGPLSTYLFELLLWMSSAGRRMTQLTKWVARQVSA
jgi:hypothetical protein